MNPAEQIVQDYFVQRRDWLKTFVTDLCDDPDGVVDQAQDTFQQMAGDMAYADVPGHPLGQPLYFCAAYLALFQILRQQGVDAHRFGSAILERLQELPEVPMDDAAGASFAGPGTHPGEFVAEVVTPAEGDNFDWGYNIKSCAICHQFGKYDAMDLVPYMCATDDIFSDKGQQGLRRTGTIALGAHQCDFRYQADGEPQRVAEAYPQKIKFVH